MASDRAERAPRSELEAELVRRQAGPASVSDVFSSVMGALDDGGALRSAWSAGRAWYAVNGDIERSHTTGVFVREPSGRQVLPTLIVYVDSRARATDFNANREIYLARLERAGLRFGEVVFRESKRRAEPTRAPRPRRTAPAPPRELAPDESAHIAELASEVPEALRESVSRAMRASWQSRSDKSS